MLPKNMYKQTYSNCCGVETSADQGELIKCSACKEWAIADYEDNEFNTIVDKIFNVLLIFGAMGTIYIMARIIIGLSN
jgi:hypothetical protein